MRWTTACWTPIARRGNCTRQGFPLKTRSSSPTFARPPASMLKSRFAKNGSLPFPVHILGNESFFVEMLQLAQFCFLRCAGTGGALRNRGGRHRSWSRRRCRKRRCGRARRTLRAFASLEALIVFRGAFDGAAFRKIGEYLRALNEMRIAGCGTCRLADFGRPHQRHAAAATEDQGQGCGSVLHRRFSIALDRLYSPRLRRIELCTTHTIESTIAAAATTGRKRP